MNKTYAQRGDLIISHKRPSSTGLLVLDAADDGSVIVEAGWGCTADEYTIVKRANFADPDDTMVPGFSNRELGTVLAALRFWQATRAGEVQTPYREEIRGIASDNGRLSPLSEAEIDELCEKINGASDKPHLIVVVEGGVVQNVSANTSAVSVEVLDHDNYDDCTFGEGDDMTHNSKCKDHTEDEFREYRALIAAADALPTEVY